MPLCGNSIGTDRRFLAAYLPEIEEHLHYRSVDVSSVKELVRRWYPDVLAPACRARRARTAPSTTSASRSTSCGATASQVFVPPVFEANGSVPATDPAEPPTIEPTTAGEPLGG